MESYTVRRYRPTDAAAVWDVHVRDLSTMLPVFSPAWATDLHDVERHFLPRGDFLVAEADGEVVASGGFRPRDEEAVKLERIRVLPAWRDSDVCDAVLAALEALARDRGAERAVLDTNGHLTRRNATVESRAYDLVKRQPLPEWGTDVLYYEKPL